MPRALPSSMARCQRKFHNYHYEHKNIQFSKMETTLKNCHVRLSTFPFVWNVNMCSIIILGPFIKAYKPSIKAEPQFNTFKVPDPDHFNISVYDLLYQLKEQFPVMNISKFPRLLNLNLCFLYMRATMGYSVRTLYIHVLLTNLLLWIW